jgi:voltage-gated potassium channel
MYQVTMTLTTVGFGELHPFDAGTRAFATVFMVVGVGAALFTLGAVFEDVLEHELTQFGRRRMDRLITRCDAHTIVCGYGRVGERVAEVLSAHDEPVVVVDADAARVAKAANDGFPAVHGDSTDDDALTEAGIERACTLVVSLGSDADAIATVLSARVLNPGLRIIARANAASSEPKLERAGADRVVNPLNQGATRMAAFAQQPSVAEFLDVVAHEGGLEYRLEELLLPPDSALAGCSLGTAQLRARTGALVLALRKPHGAFVSNPAPEVELEGDDTLIVIGTPEQLEALERLVSGVSRAS